MGRRRKLPSEVEPRIRKLPSGKNAGRWDVSFTLAGKQFRTVRDSQRECIDCFEEKLASRLLAANHPLSLGLLHCGSLPGFEP